jgi:hypothetical protein
MKSDSVFMEFLMTYGWAILVVIVAIGSLAYFGVLDNFFPNSKITFECCDEFCNNLGEQCSGINNEFSDGRFLKCMPNSSKRIQIMNDTVTMENSTIYYINDLKAVCGR